MDRRIIAIGISILLCASVAWGRMGVMVIGGTPATSSPSGYSDNFTGDNDTPLATHNSEWTSVSTTYSVSNFEITSNQLYGAVGYQNAAAYYASSTSDISQVVFKGLGGGTSIRKLLVRAGPDTLGYTLELTYYPGSNYENYIITRNGTNIKTGVLSTYASWASDHTVKFTASGTSSVILKVYIDGVEVGSHTDSTAPITSGHPGLFCNIQTVLSNCAMDDWSDN